MIYTAKVKREDQYFLAEFPDAPGCQTFAETMPELEKAAKEALEGWLESMLSTGQVPQASKVRSGKDIIDVEVDAALAVAVCLRQARAHAHLTQSQLAKRVGVSQQQIAKLEQSRANPSIGTLKKLGVALGVRPVFSFMSAPTARAAKGRTKNT